MNVSDSLAKFLPAEKIRCSARVEDLVVFGLHRDLRINPNHSKKNVPKEQSTEDVVWLTI